ncbi:AAA family ATPase [Mycobacteroides abscessus]|uniref:AAA family ATPase n=1 Tax=Mycobacteroides abscessus TaxID=36809 RepID=UPI000C25DC1A|nr:AAA family ATPase [Mycobacteroides abscessus]
MIKIIGIRIEEFRGIRQITLPFNGKSFVIHGPNGSGKSGVVDAIDFVLTGNIARLSGDGTKGVTVAKHGPHVHRRDDPASAKVTLEFEDSKSGLRGSVTRSVNKPDQPILDPDTAETRLAIEQTALHPELTLSRREIIKYIVAKPAERAQQVQSLLKLDRLGEYRKLLKAMLGKLSSELKSVKDERITAEKSFMAHLDISSLLVTEIGREINRRRQTLGLEEILDISIDTDFLQGFSADGASLPYDLKTVQKEVSTLNSQLASFAEIDAKRALLHEVLLELDADPNLLDTLRHRSLVQQGLASLQASNCPLCDVAWQSVEELRRHLEDKLERSQAAQEIKARIISVAGEYRAEVNDLADLIQRIIPVAQVEGGDELHHMLTTWMQSVRAHIQRLREFDDIAKLADALAVRIYQPPEDFEVKFTAFVEKIMNKPDLSEADAAHSFLTVAKDRWGRVRVSRASETNADGAHSTGKKIYDHYCECSDAALTSLYEAVETDFSSYYRKINIDDESGFKAALVPQTSSLDLSVDFYGIGMFPPTAYHSEGHQDGMGVCLYLALVKRLLGDDFSFAVLDDVVMSVDVNHRRQFCSLLRDEFPDVQLIITTHDEVWARQMQSAGLITSKGQAHFHGWNVNDGPLFDQGDVWKRIELDLEHNDVPAAGHKLRRRLEAACADIADLIGGQVAYRGDNNYALSELLNAVKARHTRLLKKATEAAESWKDAAATAKVAELKDRRAAVVPEQAAESWLINPVVHNNDWANVSVADFRPTLQSVQAFLDLFTCDNPDCIGWIYSVGYPEEELLRCGCGNYFINLKKKK